MNVRVTWERERRVTIDAVLLEPDFLNVAVDQGSKDTSESLRQQNLVDLEADFLIAYL